MSAILLACVPLFLSEPNDVGVLNRRQPNSHGCGWRLHHPPERSGSVYEMIREKATTGYYSVYLNDYRTQVEMTATLWTGIFRISFPASDNANILLVWNTLTERVHDTPKAD